jgi:DNA/RNA endonuclease YhcR with UshA esterase domain
MKSLYRSLFFAVLLIDWLPLSIMAQTATVIADTDAAKHVGEKVTVEGIVVEVFTHGRNFFIDLGNPYPHQTITGRIPENSELADESKFYDLEGKKIRITGTIELYKGKPEIKLISKDQLVSE